jgi:hypothetical protein
VMFTTREMQLKYCKSPALASKCAYLLQLQI